MVNYTKDPVDKIKDKSTPGTKTKSPTRNQWNTPGDAGTANDDFDTLVPDGGKEITDSKGEKGRTGTDSKGRKVTVRNNSTDGRPTLEVRDGKNVDKFRYGDKKNER